MILAVIFSYSLASLASQGYEISPKMNEMYSILVLRHFRVRGGEMRLL